MKREDLGIDREGYHDGTLTRMEGKFLGVLWVNHVGEINAIPADELAVRLAEELEEWPYTHEGFRHYKARWKRHVRTLQNHLLTQHNIPIFSRPGQQGGYWVAESDEEGERFYASFRQRGLTGLLKAARGKQSVMVEMVQQLSLEFDDLGDVTGEEIVSIGGRSTAVEVVDALIRKMTADPEKFAGDIERLRIKHGAVLMPRERVKQICETAATLQGLVEDLAI